MKKRSQILNGETSRIVTGCGNLYITINYSDGDMFEVFAHFGKSGQCGAAHLEALCRSISAGLREGVNPETFIKQLAGICCPQPHWNEGIQILSCADAISKALKRSGEELNTCQ